MDPVTRNTSRQLTAAHNGAHLGSMQRDSILQCIHHSYISVVYFTVHTIFSYSAVGIHNCLATAVSTIIIRTLSSTYVLLWTQFFMLVRKIAKSDY